MSFESVLSVANAALYEGYALYPYRASSIKNRVRFPFGGIYPPKYARAQTGADRCEVFAEFLVRSTPDTRLHLRLRFLQLCTPEPAGTERSETSGVSWQPAEERNLEFSAELAARRFEFALPAAGRAARPLTGALELSVQPLEPSLVRVRVADKTLVLAKRQP